jgi:hypothetical protein
VPHGADLQGDQVVQLVAPVEVAVRPSQRRAGICLTACSNAAARGVSGFVQHAVAVALDDVAGCGAMLAEALRATGGELTDRERAWADKVLGTGTHADGRSGRRGSHG